MIDYGNHFLKLYENWKKNPNGSHEELTKTLTLIVRSVLKKWKTPLPYNKTTEDQEDLIRDLVVFSYYCLGKVEESTSNKRLSNYIKRCVHGKLLDKTKRLSRKNNVNSAVSINLATQRTVTEDFSLIDFLESLNSEQRAFVDLIIQGEKKKDVLNTLGINNAKLRQLKKEIKEIYEQI